MSEPARAPAPTPLPDFDAVLLTSTLAEAVLGGLMLLERATLTLARAGAARLLCVGPRPPRAVRLPAIPVTWVAEATAREVALWAGMRSAPVVGLEATLVVDPATVTALAATAQAGVLQIEAPGLLWRSDASAAAALVAAAAAALGPPSAPSRRRLPGAVSWTPAGDALLARADDPASRRAAERALYARLGRAGDGWFTRLVDRQISRALTRMLLPTGITPNQITLASIAIGIVAGLLFATGAPGAAVAAALLFLASTIVDGCDGEIARLTFRESRLGATLDVVGDNVVHLVLFGGIALGLHRRLPQAYVAPLGLALVGGALLAMAVVVLFFVKRAPTPAQRALFEAFASREFAYLLVILTLAGRLEWFLWLAAVGTYAFAAGLVLLARRGGSERV